ncbi:MAG: hypothetical protein KKB81_04660 [Candidatus Margulisbacteria bacterium]|nr:hypothetical protein [Candidatus Margulisiibacteriota bacterium]MBU1022062.1 hypothetical protein [Candidatus Margulisiibacteriota bacterium]MBU1729657.1 hypothetical protein [Candidatus Margulisiibacteriota bacterium]MBU1954977.1 hypothetical protein [Candidatus Margulisiibacteriota bacterium]
MGVVLGRSRGLDKRVYKPLGSRRGGSTPQRVKITSIRAGVLGRGLNDTWPVTVQFSPIHINGRNFDCALFYGDNQMIDRRSSEGGRVTFERVNLNARYTVRIMNSIDQRVLTEISFMVSHDRNVQIITSTKAPAAPTRLSAYEAENNQVVLEWLGTADHFEYRVNHGETGATTDNIVSFRGVQSQTYRWSMCAVNVDPLGEKLYSRWVNGPSVRVGGEQLLAHEAVKALSRELPEGHGTAVQREVPQAPKKTKKQPRHKNGLTAEQKAARKKKRKEKAAAEIAALGNPSNPGNPISNNPGSTKPKDERLVDAKKVFKKTFGWRFTYRFKKGGVVQGLQIAGRELIDFAIEQELSRQDAFQIIEEEIERVGLDADQKQAVMFTLGGYASHKQLR